VNCLLDPIERALHQQGIPTQRLKGADGKRWQPDSVKLTTLHASKGLEFHTVAIVGLQAVPDARHAEDEEWRLLYVAMTRATHRLVLAGCGESGAVERVARVLKDTGRLQAEAELGGRQALSERLGRPEPRQAVTRYPRRRELLGPSAMAVIDPTQDPAGGICPR